MTTLGYYLTCDDAQCVECHYTSGGYDAWRAAGGFEGWDEPIAIHRSDESDTPTHCMTCEKLIPHRLTTDGLEYVRQAYRESARALMTHTHRGRACIVRAWVLEYLPGQAYIVADWPTRDQWSPQERTEA